MALLPPRPRIPSLSIFAPLDVETKTVHHMTMLPAKWPVNNYVAQLGLGFASLLLLIRIMDCLGFSKQGARLTLNSLSSSNELRRRLYNAMLARKYMLINSMHACKTSTYQSLVARSYAFSTKIV